MKRKLSIILSTLILCVSIIASGCSCGSVVVPTFAETEGMKFVAYCGPTIANWDGGCKNVSTITDEHFQKLVDAGFTGLHAMHEGNASTIVENYKSAHTKSLKEAMQVIPMCEKYGVTYYVKDCDFYALRTLSGMPSTKAEKYAKYEEIIKDMFTRQNEDGSYFNTYVNSSAYGGNLCDDEPSLNDYDDIKYKIELYNKYLAERGIKSEANVNLLPITAGASGLGGTYTNYISEYLEKLGPLLGYISIDYYPLLTDSTGSKISVQYLENLEMVARMVNEYKKKTGNPMELRTFIQAGGESGYGKREFTSIADFRFQIYTEMAFGTRSITYYEYGRFVGQDESDDYVLMNLQDGTYNWSYEAAAQVNNEVHEFEDAYLSYNYDGVMTFQGDPNITPAAFNRIKKRVLSSHPRINSVSVNQDTLLTSFKYSSGDDAFMLVNYSDPYFNKSDEVTIKFNDARAVLMYRFGKAEVVTLDNGSYTFELYPGEGRFIIPLK